MSNLLNIGLHIIPVNRIVSIEPRSDGSWIIYLDEEYQKQYRVCAQLVEGKYIEPFLKANGIDDRNYHL